MGGKCSPERSLKISEKRWWGRPPRAGERKVLFTDSGCKEHLVSHLRPEGLSLHMQMPLLLHLHSTGMALRILTKARKGVTHGHSCPPDTSGVSETSKKRPAVGAIPILLERWCKW